jgi:hypothetical protein
MSIEEFVEMEKGEVIEELSGMSFEELQKVSMGILMTQNIVSEIMTDMILKGEGS